MATKILIPVRSIQPKNHSTLSLDIPGRCSRCDEPNAPYMETHELSFHAGMVRNRSFPRKFHTNISFRLRLPLCEDCYKRNFIEAPESIERDRNALATLARWRGAGIRIGSLFAGLAFLLLLNIFDLSRFKINANALWLYLILISLLVFTITFGLTAVKNSQLQKELTKKGYNLKTHRTVAVAVNQTEEATPEDIAVVVRMENGPWANECAKYFGWQIQPEED